MKISIDRVHSYITKDGSEIREIIHPDKVKGARLSLAEATVLPGLKTELHKHPKSQEIYHIIQGTALMKLGEESFEITPGDSVFIAPGIEHCVENSGSIPVKIICCCSPPYSHEDTELLE
jgi:mannose-6-phosphate isomerase-like protein (cupin superfamily)